MASERIAVRVPVQPWFRDHCFNDRIIFPAVEAMHLLALTALAAYPLLEVRGMHHGRFAKLLEIPAAAAEMEVWVEMEGETSGGLCARLLTKTQHKTLARMTTHCELSFAARSADPLGAVRMEERGSDPEMELCAEEVYRHLVPFGPAYRTLQGQLLLGKGWARGTLLAPDLPRPYPDPTGSPFPLDGAMHAACVHGQRLVDFIPFPVGFATRSIPVPARAGEYYQVQVQLRSQRADEVVYDLQISDQAGRIRETVTGLRMRDVSGGRIKPPAWIKQNV